MKKSLLIFGALLVGASFINAQNVLINEFSQGNTGDHDWIELIVTANNTNLQGLYFTTTSAGAGYTGNKVQLSTSNSDLAFLPKGYIIVIYKLGTTGTPNYDPKVQELTDTDPNDGNNKLVIPFPADGSGSPDPTFFAAGSAWPGFTSTTGDNIGLFTSGGSPIFGIGYGTDGATTDNTFDSSPWGKVVIANVIAGNSAHYTGDAVTTGQEPSGTSNWSIILDSDVNCTPGATNGGSNDALPVELTSFSASVNGNSVRLTWNTATEVNNYGFEIERSSNDSGWHKIGFVAGAGNSNSPKNYSFIDNPSGALSFSYRLKQIDINGQFKYYDAVTVSLTNDTKPQLLQNSPNPFNPSTIIKFYIPNKSNVTIKIYDMLGRQVTTLFNKLTSSGYHNVYWNGKDSRGENVSSGVYLYRLTAGSFTETKKMNLLK